jgi:hypothetical protein
MNADDHAIIPQFDWPHEAVAPGVSGGGHRIARGKNVASRPNGTRDDSAGGVGAESVAAPRRVHGWTRRGASQDTGPRREDLNAR